MKPLHKGLITLEQRMALNPALLGVSFFGNFVKFREGMGYRV